MSLWLQDAPVTELRSNFTEADLQVVIRAVYKQVFGNAHLLECDRQTSAESLLRDGDITVRGFVRMVAQSDLYRSLFFDNSSQYRFIELNCKHFFRACSFKSGRDFRSRSNLQQILVTKQKSTPTSIAMNTCLISVKILFPSPRSTSDVAVSNVGFNRVYSLYRGDATSDSGKSAQLISDLAGNLPTAIVAPSKGGGTPGINKKRFRVQANKASIGSLNRVSNQTYEVSYDQLNAKIKNLHRTGAKNFEHY